LQKLDAKYGDGDGELKVKEAADAVSEINGWGDNGADWMIEHWGDDFDSNLDYYSMIFNAFD
jgi:hypothetical protein